MEATPSKNLKCQGFKGVQIKCHRCLNSILVPYESICTHKVVNGWKCIYNPTVHKICSLCGQPTRNGSFSIRASNVLEQV